MQKRILLFSGLFCSLTSLVTNAQTLVNTTGNTITNSNYHIEYSIGEIGIVTIPGAKTVTQGLLQPEVRVINPGCELINGGVIAFPNPTPNQVHLNGPSNLVEQYQIYSADGKLIESSTMVNNTIDLSRYPAALYFIRLFPGCYGHYRTLKVIRMH